MRLPIKRTCLPWVNETLVQHLVGFNSEKYAISNKALWLEEGKYKQWCNDEAQISNVKESNSLISDIHHIIVHVISGTNYYNC